MNGFGDWSPQDKRDHDETAVCGCLFFFILATMAELLVAEVVKHII